MDVVDKYEARELAAQVLDELRGESYESLVSRYLGEGEQREVTGNSGTIYQVEIQAFWDRGKPGDLGVTVAIDDGGRRAFLPLCADFLMAPDGSFIGK